MKTRIVRLGEVGVDSGQLMICDPCYIDSEWKQQEEDPRPHIEKGSFSYEGICETIGDFGGQLNYKLGHPGVAVAFRTGLGDGDYPVYAEIADIPDWGERVVRVWVDFFSNDEE